MLAFEMASGPRYDYFGARERREEERAWESGETGTREKGWGEGEERRGKSGEGREGASVRESVRGACVRALAHCIVVAGAHGLVCEVASTHMGSNKCAAVDSAGRHAPIMAWRRFGAWCCAGAHTNVWLH